MNGVSIAWSGDKRQTLVSKGSQDFVKWTFLQFPAPSWLSNRAHTITRLELTRRFFQTAELLTFSRSNALFNASSPFKMVFKYNDMEISVLDDI